MAARPGPPMPALVGRSMLDIAPVSVGKVLRSLSADDDLLGGMVDEQV